jgi:dihydrodipicolinate synthase/N-acetylneuraminate lyase
MADHYAAASRELPVNIVTAVFIPRGQTFALETIRKAFDRSERVVAIKDDFCGDFAQKLCLAEGHRAAIYAGGLKQNHLSMWPFGGVCGYLASFISFQPDVTHAYWSAIGRSDLESARRIIRDIDNPWIEHLMTYPGGFDAAMHGLGEIYGISQRWRRPPYTSLNDADLERLRDFMARLPKP